MKFNPSYSLYMAIIVSLGGFVFGFDASVISGVVGYVSRDFNLSAWEIGIVVAAPTLGGFIGSFLAGPLADQFGRKRVLITVAALYVVSAVASAFAFSFESLTFARFIGGLAFVSLMLAPMYIAEISPSHLRGKRVSINQLNIVVGFSIAYFANYLFLLLSELDSGWISLLGIDQHTWRWMLGIEAIPALAYMLLLFLIPESPRWLVVNHQEEKARSVYRKLRSDFDMDTKIQSIRDSVNTTRESFKDRLASLFDKKLRLVLMVGVIAAIAQQITGVNAIYFYAPTIFEQSGVGTNAAFSQAVWIGIINIIFTLLAMALIDRVGRKPLMLTGLFGVFISMSVCSWGFSQATYQLTDEKVSTLSQEIDRSAIAEVSNTEFDSDVVFKNSLRNALGEQVYKNHESDLIKAAVNINATLVLFGILGFVASFAISLGPVMWVLLSEIFPNQIRGIAISFVSVINAAVSFNVQLIFPKELEVIGAANTFMIYGIFAVIGFVLLWWLLPETKGKTLEQLESQLQSSSTNSKDPITGVAK